MALDKLTIIDGGGLSTTSDYRVGVITATKFVGPLDGTSGNFSGDITTRNINSSGILTASSASFSGSVSIGGTLTYEDVTNIDSVGLITARDGIFIPDSQKIEIGHLAGNPDLSINSFPSLEQVSIDYTRSGAGRAFRIRSTFTQFENWNGLAPIAKFIGGVGVGHVELNYAGDKKFETTAKGIQVGTGVTIETNGNSNFVGVSSLGTGDTGAVYLYNPDADALSGTTNDIYGWKAKTYEHGLQVNSSLYLSRSGSNGLRLTYNNATGSYITAQSGFLRLGVPYGGYFNIYSNDVYIKNSSQDSTFAHFEKVSNFLTKTHLYSQNQIKLSTEPSGISVVGTTTSTQLAVTGVSTFTGTVNLSTINSTASNLAIHNTADRVLIKGSNRIDISDDFVRFQNRAQNASLLEAVAGGSGYIRLFHNNVNKFETTSYGAIVDPVSGYNDSSASPARLSLGGSFSNTSAITTKPKLTLWENSSNNDAMGFQITASLLSVHLSKTSYDFAIKAAGSTILQVDSGNNETNYSTDHDLNLNASTNKSGIIRFNNYAPTPAGPNKIILWEDSTWSGGFGVSSNHVDYYSGHTHCFYTGTTTSSIGEIAAEFKKDGAVDLYHNGTKRIETTSIGAKIDTTLLLYGDAGNPGRLRLQEGGALTEIRCARNSDSNSLLYFQTEIAGSTATRVMIDQYGHFVPGAANTYDLGGSTAEFRHLYIGDSGEIRLGSDQDAKIYHNGTNLYLTNTTGNFFFSNSGYTYIDQNHFRIRNAAGNHMIDANNSGTHQGVGLYYTAGSAGTEKLKTTSTGIRVNGEVAASQDYPNFRPILDLNFAAEKKLDPRITYTRSGPASYTNEFSEVVLVGDNVPRFDHDLTTGECKGLLNEEEVTNTCTYSDIGQTTLNSSGIGGNNGSARISTDFITPEGKFGRCLNFTMRSTVQGGYYRRGGYIDITAGEKYTISMFIRNGDPDNQDLEAASSGTYLGIHLYKTGSGQNAGMGFGHADMKKERYAHGWTRYSATFTAQATATGVHGYFNIASSSVAYLDWNLQLWGFQIEAGGYSTSYIPTGAYSVTRGADTTVIDGDEFNEFFDHRGNESNNYQGTLLAFLEQPVESFPSTGRYNKIQLELSNDNKVSLATLVLSAGSPDVQGMISYGTATQIDKTSSGSAFPTIVKHGIAYAKNSGAYTYNGNTVQTDNTMNVASPTTKYTQLTIGGVPRKSHIKRIMYYNNRISDTQLRNLTS